MTPDISAQEYWKEIDELCAEALEQAREGKTEPHDWLWETLDGHQWVIYTGYAFDVLKHSDNDGYAIEAWGPDGIVADGSIQWGKLVFGAMYGDCMDRADFDWHRVPDDEAETAEEESAS